MVLDRKMFPEEQGVTIQTADGLTFCQPLENLRKCKTIKHVAKEVDTTFAPIPLSQVFSQDFQHVLQFIKTGRVIDVPPDELPGVIRATNYLEYGASLNAHVQRCAELIREVPYEQLKAMFGSPAEEHVEEAVKTWF